MTKAGLWAESPGGHTTFYLQMTGCGCATQSTQCHDQITAPYLLRPHTLRERLSLAVHKSTHPSTHPYQDFPTITIFPTVPPWVVELKIADSNCFLFSRLSYLDHPAWWDPILPEQFSINPHLCRSSSLCDNFRLQLQTPPFQACLTNQSSLKLMHRETIAAT